MTEAATPAPGADIYRKFIAAQADFSNIAQERKAMLGGRGAGGYCYADISAVLNKLRPVLNRHGLGVIQTTRAEGSTVIIETIVFDETGAEIRSGELAVPTEGLIQKGVQAFGSAVTYARRYSLVTFLAAAYGEQDDDGQTADGQTDERQPPRHFVNHRPATEQFVLTEEMVDKAKAVAAQGPESYKQYFSGISKEMRKALVSTGWHDRLKQMSSATVEG